MIFKLRRLKKENYNGEKIDDKQCESMTMVERKLGEMGINLVRQRVEEGGVYVDQLFFHDPDGFMIEICNCDNIPMIPLAGEVVRSCSRLNLQMAQQQPQPQQIQFSVVQP